MPLKMPRLDDLLALLEAPPLSGAKKVLGGTATKAELEAQLRPPLVFVLLPISSISPIPASHLPLPPWADRPSSLVVTVLSGFFGPPRRPQSVPPAMISQKSVRLNCFHSRHSTASFRESPDPPCCFEQLLTAA
ncbi:hypothetical protein BFJ72_g7241 [Fusarium proliferatum]|uniref:Uncharacterized protein n=1 Tax=Gibberella intermedia TaxID=948311 RepID=A0A420TA82_GIBIN|nr:hypothetical protein BFJ72_g7241 [Fusarium proliferatum]